MTNFLSSVIGHAIRDRMSTPGMPSTSGLKRGSLIALLSLTNSPFKKTWPPIPEGLSILVVPRVPMSLSSFSSRVKRRKGSDGLSPFVISVAQRHLTSRRACLTTFQQEARPDRSPEIPQHALNSCRTLSRERIELHGSEKLTGAAKAAQTDGDIHGDGDEGDTRSDEREVDRWPAGPRTLPDLESHGTKRESHSSRVALTDAILVTILDQVNGRTG
eukprot:GHVT01019368.1.p2 GENE.GHVT01019368.1~~GHVT01019368.1.p2  ORF type:complete len:217 (-),score=8.99 GHVT01019368.1:5996-6646(-)